MNKSLKKSENPKTITIFGDWHANTQFALRALRSSTDADIYLHVGDFGIWPDTIKDKSNSFISLVNKELKNQNKELWFVDGNHENFEILHNLHLDERGLGIVASNIFHIPRAHRWTWNDRVFMGLGGAVSVDREHRTPYIDYFPEEELTLGDFYNAVTGPVDVLITHEAPSGYKPVPDKSFGEKIDQDTKSSMDTIKAVVDQTKPKILIHGHYHTRKDSFYEDTKIIALAHDRALTDDAISTNKETLYYD